MTSWRSLDLASGHSLLAGVLGFAAVAGAAFDQGGYYPTAWGLFVIVAVWLVVVRLVLADVRLGTLEVVVLLTFAAFACWIAASTVWGVPERGVLETERIAVYVTALFAASVVLPRHGVPALITGMWAAVTLVCGYGLLTRLFPERWSVFDPLAGYRLSEPLGYWNGLGVMATLGALLALGLASRASTVAGRTVAAASLPLLASTLYFTFSRGAWIALAAGLVAAIAIDSGRLQLVTRVAAFAPAVMVTLVVAYRSEALNRIGASSADATREGHRLAIFVAASAVVNALVTLVLEHLERRIGPRPRLRRAYAGGLIAAILAALLVVFVRFGSPPTLAVRTYDAFAAPPPTMHGKVTDRLFNLSGSGRLVQWRVAWRAYRAEAVVRVGGGHLRRIVERAPADALQGSRCS